jgi:hypothetical protein
MNKSTFLLFMAATSMLGCKNLAPVELVEPQPPPSSIPKPTEHPETIAWRSKKTSWSEPPRPAEQSSTPGSKTDNTDKRRPAGAANKAKPAGMPKKDPGEKTIAATPPANVPLSGIPRDVWYAILTIFGAVFTSILGPIAVEIIRERMIISRQQKQNAQDGECVAKQVS